MLHTFRGDQPIRHALDLRGRALHHDHFKTFVMIEVHVQRGQDLVMKLVLENQ